MKKRIGRYLWHRSFAPWGKAKHRIIWYILTKPYWGNNKIAFRDRVRCVGEYALSPLYSLFLLIFGRWWT